MGQDYRARLAEIEALDLAQLTDLGLTRLWGELDVMCWQVQRRAIEGAEDLIAAATRKSEEVEKEQESRGELGYRTD